MSLIGVGGYAGSGKDTVANHLVAKYSFVRDAFADRLRKGLLALDPIVYANLRLSILVDTWGWDSAKRKYPEVRALQQRYGDEAGRQIHGKDCWVDALFNSYDGDVMGQHLVISDVRYPNEIEAIRDYNGTLLWVERPGVGPVNSHASDNSVGPQDFDYVIENDGTLEDLYAKIDLIMENETL
jgi:hypothetical protein